MGTILQLLAERECSVSELVASLPKYHMQKLRIPCTSEQAQRMLAAVKELFTSYRIDTRDGVKVSFEDGSWFHVRASRTEPLVRLVVEARTEKRVSELIETVQKHLRIEKLA
ncbi:MAG: phosphoglucosamine mutase, partial [Armatimonadota bacterium]